MTKIFGTGDLFFYEFSEGLAKDKASFEGIGILQSIFFPVFLSIPQKISNATIYLSLGFNVFFIFVFKYKSFFTKEFWFVLFVTITILSLPNFQPRYFLDVYLVLICLLAKNFNQLKEYKLFKYFNILLAFQSGVILCFLIISLYTLTLGSLSPTLYKKIMSENAHNFNVTNWIHENVPKNSLIVSNAVRSHALYKNNFISREVFFRDPIKNSYKYKPDYIGLNEDDEFSDFTSKCLIDYKHNYFFKEIRNFISRNKETKFKVTLYKNKCK